MVSESSSSRTVGPAYHGVCSDRPARLPPSRALIGMKSRLVFSGESTGARAASLASDLHRLGRPRSLDEMAAEVDAVTLERVNGYLAGRELGRTTVQTLGPAALTMPG